MYLHLPKNREWLPTALWVKAKVCTMACKTPWPLLPSWLHPLLCPPGSLCSRYTVAWVRPPPVQITTWLIPWLLQVSFQKSPAYWGLSWPYFWKLQPNLYLGIPFPGLLVDFYKVYHHLTYYRLYCVLPSTPNYNVNLIRKAVSVLISAGSLVPTIKHSQ